MTAVGQGRPGRESSATQGANRHRGSGARRGDAAMMIASGSQKGVCPGVAVCSSKV